MSLRIANDTGPGGYTNTLRRAAHLLALLMAAFVVAFGMLNRTSTASGADAYGYLSQADLWRQGNLHVSQPFMLDYPWPDPAWTAAPMGYRPAPGDSPSAIVPIYSPGLPILMAIAKSVAGHRAVFWIVPLLGGLFVLSTYGIGLRIGNVAVALSAALLAALSPTVLFMSMWPMTDLSVAACWAAATWAVMGSSRKHALAGGLMAALAIMIRPNLIAVGLCVGLWTIIRDVRRSEATWWRVDRAAMFALGAAPGAVAIMIFNAMLYGSPLRSGYGTLQDVLHLSNIPINVAHYFQWLVESQSGLVVIGLIPLTLPLTQIWRDRDRAMNALLLLLVAVGTLSCYLLFMPLDEWWYLRFLLTMFPGLFVGTCWAALTPASTAARRGKVVHVAIGVLTIGAIAWWGVHFAQGKRFDRAHEGEGRFITIAQLVRDRTEPNAIIFALQHGGSIRYYGERMTFKFDSLDPAWLDIAVEFFSARGAHPYVVLDEWEVDKWKQWFGNGSARGRLELAPVFEEQWPTHVWLFDLEKVGVVPKGSWPYIDGFHLPRPPADLAPAPPPVFKLTSGRR